MSVSEQSDRVSHYIIQRKGTKSYLMGDRYFEDLVAIVEFYKTHLLDCTTLSVPLPLEGKLSKGVLQASFQFTVRAKFNFHAKDAEDLTFRKGDLLNVLSQHEPQWWRVQSQKTLQIGCVPINYIERLDAGAPPLVSRDSKFSRTGSVTSPSPNSGRALPPVPGDDDDGVPPPPLPVRGSDGPAAPSRGDAPPLPGSRRAQPPPPPPPEDDEDVPPLPVGRPSLPPSRSQPAPPVPAPAAAVPARPPPAAPVSRPPPALPVTEIISRPPPPVVLSEPLPVVSMLRNAAGELPTERPKFLVARATIDRVASAYDRTALSFKAGDCIHVLKQNENGLWKGLVVGGDGKEGFFPFTLVELLDCAEYDEDIASMQIQFNIQMDAIYGTN